MTSANTKYSTCLEYNAGGLHLVVYTDDDGASGYGDNPMVGYWYGPRETLMAMDPSTIPLLPTVSDERPDPFDMACERKYD